MAGIFESISDLIGSIINLFVSFVQSIFAAIQGVVTSAADVSMGLVNFLLQNIVAIGVLIAVIVGFSAYKQRHGETIMGKKRA